VLQVSVLLAHLADAGDRPADPEVADLLARLADAVDVLAERPGELAAALDAPGAEVRRLRNGADAEAARGACMIAVSDAVAELDGVSWSPGR
jgi:hypothetical protein